MTTEGHGAGDRVARWLAALAIAITFAFGCLSLIDARRTEFLGQRAACEQTLTSLVGGLTERAALANLVADKTMQVADLAIVQNYAKTAGLWAAVNLDCMQDGFEFITVDDAFGRSIAGARSGSDSAFGSEVNRPNSRSASTGALQIQDAVNWATGAIRQVQRSTPPGVRHPKGRIVHVDDFELGCRYAGSDWAAKPDCS